MSTRLSDVVELASFGLPDVQAEVPAIPLALDEAGITDLRYPLTVYLADGHAQQTVATVSLAAGVAASTRGVHMSRFIEVLHAWRDRISVPGIMDLLEEVRERLQAETASATFVFPVFLERVAPVSGGGALVPYDCRLEAEAGGKGRACRLAVRVPITSLCPCSREISDYGAHNQRGSVEIAASPDTSVPESMIGLAELIAIAEEAGSAPIYSLLKRSDERYVTMRAYENPAFVEDITRAVADALHRDERIESARVQVVNEESIHTHNAYAAVAWSRR